MWNPRYDRPSLGGEGDCTAEAVWEVGRKNILKLCGRCVNLRPFVKWEKRRIERACDIAVREIDAAMLTIDMVVDALQRTLGEKLARFTDTLDRLNTRTEGLILRVEIVERDMRHARAWVAQEIDTQRKLKDMNAKIRKLEKGLIA